MGWSKAELVTEAFSELALQGFQFDLTDDERQSALRRLDGMLAMWGAQGIRLGYAMPSSPANSSLDQDSNLPDWANEAVYLNLAIRLAPGYGKQLSPATLATASDALDAVKSQMAMPPEMQYPSTMPRGAGNKPWRTVNNPFMRKPEDPVQAGGDGNIDLN